MNGLGTDQLVIWLAVFTIVAFLAACVWQIVRLRRRRRFEEARGTATPGKGPWPLR